MFLTKAKHVRLFIVSYFFFFSSRRRHTISKRDWSSDVCSSDLDGAAALTGQSSRARAAAPSCTALTGRWPARSEERRVGKECRSRAGRDQERKKMELR